MAKPNPKYGWYGQANPCASVSSDKGEIQRGDRVYHYLEPQTIGTVVDGPTVVAGSPWWIITWDAFPQLGRISHPCHAIRKVQ